MLRKYIVIIFYQVKTLVDQKFTKSNKTVWQLPYSGRSSSTKQSVQQNQIKSLHHNRQIRFNNNYY